MPNIIEITDFEAPELDVYARLTENQYSTATNQRKVFSLLKAQRLLNVLWTRAVFRFRFCSNENM